MIIVMGGVDMSKKAPTGWARVLDILNRIVTVLMLLPTFVPFLINHVLATKKTKIPAMHKFVKALRTESGQCTHTHKEESRQSSSDASSCLCLPVCQVTRRSVWSVTVSVFRSA
jgi:hypothetical protein